MSLLARINIGLVAWLVCGEVAHRFAGVHSAESFYNASPVACDKPAYGSAGGDQLGSGRFEPQPPGSIPGRCPNIPQLIRLAAAKYGVDPQRTLALSWRESRWTDAVRHEKNGSLSCGPLQTNSGSFPGICEASLERRVEVGVSHFSKLVARYGDDAETVYRFGRRRK